jgi:hypothetical protein
MKRIIYGLVFAPLVIAGVQVRDGSALMQVARFGVRQIAEAGVQLVTVAREVEHEVETVRVQAARATNVPAVQEVASTGPGTVTVRACLDGSPVKLAMDAGKPRRMPETCCTSPEASADAGE